MANYVPSREAVKRLGVCANTLRRMAKDGEIDYIRTASNQRKYNVDKFLGEEAQSTQICYCRVSSYKQKDDLERQIKYMQERHPDAEIVKDIGSGLNFKRKGLRSVVERAIRGERISLVVAHRDRLARFGFDLISWILGLSDGEVVVLSNTKLSPYDELTQDLLTILHVFSARLHGLRSYKVKIAKDLSNKRGEE